MKLCNFYREAIPQKAKHGAWEKGDKTRMDGGG